MQSSQARQNANLGINMYNRIPLPGSLNLINLNFSTWQSLNECSNLLIKRISTLLHTLYILTYMRSLGIPCHAMYQYTQFDLIPCIISMECKLLQDRREKTYELINCKYFHKMKIKRQVLLKGWCYIAENNNAKQNTECSSRIPLKKYLTCCF